MIYLDYNATTPIAPEVLVAMLPYLKDEWGNAASTYRFGAKLKSVIEEAREKVADLLGASPFEILFTSCGTESNNAAINAALLANPAKKHLITCETEHSSVLSQCKALEKQGYSVTYLTVNRDGLLNMSELEAAINEQTALVSIMWANNETGVLSPVEKIGTLCRERGVLYHCDAVQAAGKVPINLSALPVDYLSITGHKIGAPKGVGALFIRKKTPFTPYLFGGHQERERRGGTEAVAFIVGLGVAASLASDRVKLYSHKVAPLRDGLQMSLLRNIDGAEVNGGDAPRISNTLNISIKGISSEPLLLLLDQAGICASSGSACLADSDEPSHVIAAMKPGDNACRSALRVSIGVDFEQKQIEIISAHVRRCVMLLRGS